MKIEIASVVAISSSTVIAQAMDFPSELVRTVPNMAAAIVIVFLFLKSMSKFQQMVIDMRKSEQEIANQRHEMFNRTFESLSEGVHKLNDVLKKMGK